MPAPPDDQRPPLVVAIQWVSQITTVSLEMVLPAALGYWLDGTFGTEPWLTIVGAVLGFGIGLRHLLELTAPSDKTSKHKTGTADDENDPNGR